MARRAAVLGVRRPRHAGSPIGSRWRRPQATSADRATRSGSPQPTRQRSRAADRAVGLLREHVTGLGAEPREAPGRPLGWRLLEREPPRLEFRCSWVERQGGILARGALARFLPPTARQRSGRSLVSPPPPSSRDSSAARPTACPEGHVPRWSDGGELQAPPLRAPSFAPNEWIGQRQRPSRPSSAQRAARHASARTALCPVRCASAMLSAHARPLPNGSTSVT